jgi:hypothetical protein
VIVSQLPSCDNTHTNGFRAADCYPRSYPWHSTGSSTHHRLDDRGGCRVPVHIVEGTQPSPACVRRRQILFPGHEFRCQTSEGIFHLRTLWVVTLCSQRPTTALLGRAVAQPCATTPLAALFGPKRYWLRFSKPVRQFMRIETTGFFTDNLPVSAIRLSSDSVDTAGKNYQGVYIAELLQSIVDSSSDIVTKKQPVRPSKQVPFVPSDDPVTQDEYWKAIQNFLRPGDVIVVEDGASSAGMGRLTLPEASTYITGAFVWCSIGYATPALLGAILASPGRRHILLTGEGSLQMTVQELSTVMRHDLKPFIFVINNSGYTVERAVLGKDAKYNDIANWRYSELPNVFSRDNKAETHVVQTSNELQKVLDSPHSEMVFVESVMDKYDAPIDLIVGGHALADSDYGVPGPQAAANAQIPFPTRHSERNADASGEGKPVLV